MYRTFREYINEHIGAAIAASCPMFSEVKSLARAGGRAFRYKRGDGGAVILFLAHVADRDLFRLELGWTKDVKFKAWDDLAWQQACGGPSLMQPVRAAARTDPTSLWQLHEPGLLLAADCSTLSHPGEIRIDEGVPWEQLADLLGSADPAANRIGMVLDAAIVESLSRGEVPPWAPANPSQGVREPFRLHARLVSWESWFEFILCRPASDDEIEAITLAACAEAKLQLKVLTAVARVLAAAAD